MTFKCVCIKCRENFVSEDKADFDGNAFCPPCVEKNKEVAAKVDAMIAAKRVNRPQKEIINPYAEMRSNPKTRNSRRVQYMNVPRNG